MSQQPEINHPLDIDLELSEGHVEQDIETNSFYEEDIINQEYNRESEKHYKDSPTL